MSKWVGVIALPINDAKIMVKFLHKNIFVRFGTLKAIISYERTFFYNKMFAAALAKYEIKHKVTTLYYPQTSGQGDKKDFRENSEF